MNCCNEYGDCTQGSDCPARRLTPFKAAPKRIEISTVGAYDSRLEWPDTVPPEAGNVRLVPVGEADGEPLTRAENMALAWTLAAWLAGVVCFVAVVAFATGYITERWPDVLWAYLAALS